jgi:hypothetical protein
MFTSHLVKTAATRNRHTSSSKALGLLTKWLRMTVFDLPPETRYYVDKGKKIHAIGQCLRYSVQEMLQWTHNECVRLNDTYLRLRNGDWQKCGGNYRTPRGWGGLIYWQGRECKRPKVRISPKEWISFSCNCCVLLRGGICVGLISRPEESYRMWFVWVWSWSLNHEATLHKAREPTRGCRALCRVQKNTMNTCRPV